MEPTFLSQLVVYLIAMIIAVPIAKACGLGAVLGYLIGGIALGPFGFDLIASAQQHAAGLAEFGVIMMLLLIGLELNPRLLWKMRGPIFGLGAAQVGATTLAISGAAFAIGLTWQAAVAIGMTLSLSSTAIVIQTLQEKGHGKSDVGKSAFAVLLFQDLAVIPMLAILPLLAYGSAELSSSGHPINQTSGIIQAVKTVAAVAAVLLLGRFAVKPLFRVAAKLKLRETFTAIALVIVVGATYIMHLVELSPALGAFLAGVVLADSEFKHQIETDLEPFKGLLLGLFFISVGAGINFSVVYASPATAATLVFLIVAIKFAVMFVINWLTKLNRPDNLLLSLSLAQGGEFGFVLLGILGSSQVLAAGEVQLATASVAISMALAPIIISTAVRFVCQGEATTVPSRDADLIEEKNSVLVVGAGRFGQVVVRLLTANNIKPTVLDFDSEQIEAIARFNFKTYFGDGTSLDLLRAAGLADAKVLVVAIDDAESALKIVTEVKQNFPAVVVVSRAYDRVHAYRLLNAGVDDCFIETAGSAVSCGSFVLESLGMSARASFRQSRIFATNNQKMIREMAPVYKSVPESTFLQEAKVRLEALQRLMKTERADHQDPGTDGAWESAPRSN